MRISDWSSDVCSSDLVGARGAADTDALLRKVTERCLPNRILQVVAAGEALPEGHPAAGKGQVEDQATAYLCRGTVCSLPMTDPAKLAAALDAGAKRPCRVGASPSTHPPGRPPSPRRPAARQSGV